MALEQVIDVLSDTCRKCAVLTDTFPKCKEEVCGILVLEQEVDFINKDESCLTFALFCVIRLRMLSITTSIPIDISCLPRSRIS